MTNCVRGFRLTQAFGVLLETAEEIVLDVPKLRDLLGRFIARVRPNQSSSVYVC